MRTSRLAQMGITALVGSAVLLAPLTSFAFQVKRTDEGATIKWNRAKVAFKLNEGGSDDMGFEATRRAIKASFDQWNLEHGTDIELTFEGTTTDTEPGFNRSGENTNLVTFEEEAWPFEQTALAVTLTTFNTRTGELLDADIIVNGQHYTWGNGGEEAQHDLANSLTHEVGHFVGLDHSHQLEATMYPSAHPGELKKRDLSDDDTAGLFALYGNGEEFVGAGPDDPTALPGEEDFEGSFNPESGVRLNDAQVHMACSSAAPGAPQGMGTGVLVAMLGLFGFVMLRRRKSRRMVLALAACAAVFVPTTASATEMPELKIDELVTHADKIVMVEVVGHRSEFQGGIIWTRTRVRVTDCLEDGDCVQGDEVVVATPGGVVGDIGQEVSGVSHPQMGQSLVLFLRKGAGNIYRPVGMAQGVLRVENLAGMPMVVRDLSKTNLARRSMTMPLFELRELIKR
jgi:MYXO-CTERM domain-containing protein